MWYVSPAFRLARVARPLIVLAGVLSDRAGLLALSGRCPYAGTIRPARAGPKVAGGNSVLLGDYAPEMTVQEELHLGEVNKMLRRLASLRHPTNRLSAWRKRYPESRAKEIALVL